MRQIVMAAVLAMIAGPVMAAGEFAEGSKAKSWGLLGEENARFEAKVVDTLCELTGDCPDNCGDGGRYLGLVRSADEALVPVAKNLQGVFTGAIEDLLPYCGKMVEVDGLLVGDEDTVPAKMFQVQRIRVGDGEWHKANGWTKAWRAANPDIAAAKGRWYRKDHRVMGQIEAHGYLGLGQEIDAEFKEYWFSE